MNRCLALAFAALLAITGCADSPKTRFYVLEPVAPRAAASIPAAAGPPIVVDSVNIPDYLDRPQMVRRLGTNRLDVAGEDRWASPLAGMIRRVLVEDLSRRLPPDMVVPATRTMSLDRSRVVTVSIDDFAPDGTGQVRLVADWMLLVGSDRNPAMQREETIHVAMAQPGFAAQASAMSQALGILADRIAGAVARRPDRISTAP